MFRVFVFSPDAQRLAALQRVLSEAGLAVQGGTQAQGVLAGAVQAGASVVVADIPVGDTAGAALQAALTAQPSPIPVLLLVQRVDDAGVGVLFQAGVADILEQPLTPAVLVERTKTLGATASGLLPPGQQQVLALRRMVEFVLRTRRGGLITVDTPQGRAHIMVRQGALVSAQYGSLTHDAAARALMALTELHGFFFQPVPDDARMPSAPPPVPQDAGQPAAGPSEPITATEVIPGSAQAFTPPPARVLVVDDDEALLEIACRFLQRGGLEVGRATNGQAGLERALQTRPHIIVSDIMMPEVDGWALLRLVRDDHRLRELPFILLSCHDEYRDKLKQVGAGANAYLAKGIKGDQLMGTVLDAVAAHRLAWSLAAPGIRLEGRLDEVGPLNLVRALAFKGATGTLHAQDQWVHAVLGLQDGALVGAGATSDLITLTGMDAVKAYVKLRGARFVFDPLQVPPPGEGADVEASLDEACALANQSDEEVRERLMTQGGGLIIQPELMALYGRVTEGVPPPVLERLAKGMSPGEVMAETGESPLLVEWVVKDMVRKGVAVFRDAPAPGAV